MTTVAARWMDRWKSCSRREGLPLWFLPWMPAVLLIMDDSPDAASAAIRLGTVALLAATIWATGRGRAGHRSEAGLVAGLVVVWSAAVASILWMRGFPESAGGLALLAGVNLGAAAVAVWAWRRRRSLSVLETSRRAADPVWRPERRIIFLVWLGVYAAVIWLLGAPIVAEGIVMVVALAFYVALAVRGRSAEGAGTGRSDR